MRSPGNEIRCVLFDAVSTLMYPSPPVAAAYGAVAWRHGSSLSEAQIGRRFRAAFRRQEAIDTTENGSRTDEAREWRRWQVIVAETLADVADSEAAFKELWRHFGLAENWRLFDDVADVWPALARRGYRLGIASNFDGRLRAICRGLPPLDDCSDVFVSSELGVRKPAAEFFHGVRRRLGLSAEEILLIGDDLANDYVAARSAGWRALLLDRAGECAPAVESVSSLRALLEYLGVR